jgi:polar amino acid transport system substrate-binding protein
MTRHRTRMLAGLALLAALALTAAGCSAPSRTGPGASSFPAPRPQGVQDPAPISSAAADPGDTCNARASLRPPAALPAPGQMPAGSTMARIQQSGLLRVGVSQDTFLFGYRNPLTGQIEGFDVDVVRKIANAIFGSPDKIQLVAVTSAQRIPYILDNKVDIVAHTMTINCARRQQVDFSSVYYLAGQRVLVSRDSPAKDLAGLKGKKVCAAAGSTSIQHIAENPAKTDPPPVPVSVNDWNDCLVMLQQGQVDAISTDDTILAGMHRQDPDNTQLVGDKFSQEPYGLAMSKNSPDLVRFVNGVLQQMRDDGSLHAINVDRLKDAAPGDVPLAAYRD